MSKQLDAAAKLLGDSVPTVASDDAFTSAELAGSMGLSTAQAQRKIAAAVQEGRMVCVRIRVPDARGIIRPVPAYQVVSKQKKGG